MGGNERRNAFPLSVLVHYTRYFYKKLQGARNVGEYNKEMPRQLNGNKNMAQ
jgi:hypothetical protein